MSTNILWWNFYHPVRYSVGQEKNLTPSPVCFWVKLWRQTCFAPSSWWFKDEQWLTSALELIQLASRDVPVSLSIKSIVRYFLRYLKKRRIKMLIIIQYLILFFYLHCFVSCISMCKQLLYLMSLARKKNQTLNSVRTMIYKWPILYPVLFSLSCNHKITVYCDWQRHFPPVMSFWLFPELNKLFSLFPSPSLSWLFVCWDKKFFTHSLAGLLLADLFLFFSQ